MNDDFENPIVRRRYSNIAFAVIVFGMLVFIAGRFELRSNSVSSSSPPPICKDMYGNPCSPEVIGSIEAQTGQKFQTPEDVSIGPFLMVSGFIIWFCGMICVIYLAQFRMRSRRRLEDLDYQMQIQRREAEKQKRTIT